MQPPQQKVNWDQCDESEHESSYPDRVLSFRLHALVNGETQGRKKYQYLQELIESWLANCANENVKTNGV